MVSDEISAVILNSLSLAAFKIFFLVFSFQSLIMMCLGMDFFEFILLGVLSASGICRFMSVAKFGEFSAIISASSLTATLSLLLPGPQ